jgi:DNA-binding response OmpR family regulator
MTPITSSKPRGATLEGVTVLVVEDEYLVAMELTAMLRDHGARVLGPIPDAIRARALMAADTPDCVLMDINLKGERVFDLAQELLERGVPVIFATGYDATALPENLQCYPRLQKPVDPRALIATVKQQVTSPLRRSADSSQ